MGGIEDWQRLKLVGLNVLPVAIGRVGPRGELAYQRITYNLAEPRHVGDDLPGHGCQGDDGQRRKHGPIRELNIGGD